MPLISQCTACLHDTKLYLNTLTETEYSQPIALMSNSTIGQHTRHFLEFFQCLSSQAATGTVNYDLRKRDLRIEQNPQFALQVIETIMVNLDELDLDKTLNLEAEFGEKAVVPTNIAREMLYNIEHCIHHLALIKIGLAIIKPDLELPKNFGVAASTVKHRQKEPQLVGTISN